jgi:thioredoxin reductase
MTERPFAPGAYPVVVVGTGPGGLQLSYDLRRLGIRHAVLSDDEGPGGMFRRYPMFDRLNTSSRPQSLIPRESADYYRVDHNALIAGEPTHRALVPEFMDRAFYFPSRPEMLRSLEAFVERAGLEVRYRCRWESTRADGDRFVLGTSDGEYRCQLAIFAVGMAEPWKPPTPGVEEALHYVDLRGRRPEEFAGKSVFIVGKRNSAFEIATELLPWARQIVLGSPHRIRPSVVTGIPTPPKARYLEPFEDHLFGGGTFVVDCAIERVERTGSGFRVYAEGTTTPGSYVFEADEVIAATGFQTPLGDLRQLGVATFYKDRLPAQTHFWESTTVPGIFFAGATAQGQAGLRKYGYPSRSASVAGFRYCAVVQAEHIARRFGHELARPALAEEDVVPFLLELATSDPGIWSQQSHLARVVSFDDGAGIRDEGLLPLAPFVDAAGPDAVAITVETDPERRIRPAVYLRRNARATEHLLDEHPTHDFRGPDHRAALTSLLRGLVR